MKITMIDASANPAGTCAHILAKIAGRIPNKRRVKRFALNDMNIHGCQECFSCRSSGTDTCYFMDDIPLVLDAIKKTEYLIVASPVFFSDVSAQLKCVIDRTQSFFGADGTADRLPRDRRLLFILSHQPSERDECGAIVDRYEPCFRRYGFSRIELIAIDSAHQAIVSGESAEIERRLDELFPRARENRADPANDIDLLENR